MTLTCLECAKFMRPACYHVQMFGEPCPASTPACFLFTADRPKQDVYIQAAPQAYRREHIYHEQHSWSELAL